jgi:hypothetical protein
MCTLRIIDTVGVLVVLGRSVITSTEMCKIWIDVSYCKLCSILLYNFVYFLFKIIKVYVFHPFKADIPVFSGVRVTRSLVLCVCFVDRCLFF